MSTVTSIHHFETMIEEQSQWWMADDCGMRKTSASVVRNFRTIDSEALSIYERQGDSHMEGTFEQTSTSEKKHGKSGWLIAVLIVIIIALAAALILTMSRNGVSDGIAKGKASIAEASNGEITTPVGTLVFPAEWANSVWAEDTSSGSQYSAKFYGSVGNDKVLLFELSVGANGTGYQIGNAPDEEGALQAVWLNISEIRSKESWTEDQVSQINVMQGCVNDLIEQVRALDGFQENG